MIQEEMERLIRDLDYYKPRNLKPKSLKNAQTYFMEEICLLMHLKKTSFLFLEKKCLNMKNEKKKKTKNLMMNLTLQKQYHQKVYLI